MTDLVERLRERLGRRTVTVSAGLYEDIRDAATALEAKDKELAALRERVKELETDVWPQWASEIWEKLKEYGCQDDDDGSVDLSDQFSVWVDEYASECQARAETADHERDEARKSADKCLREVATQARLRGETERKLDEANALAASLRRSRDRIADELDTMNNNHRLMAKLLADTGRERDEAREALKPFRIAASRALAGEGSPEDFLEEEHFAAARAITGEKT
jgi:uncharacterized coiled-coil DUF342 family protein